MVPNPGSPIPGAPAAWNPPAGMEQHIPVLFLDLNGNFFHYNVINLMTYLIFKNVFILLFSR